MLIEVASTLHGSHVFANTAGFSHVACLYPYLFWECASDSTVTYSTRILVRVATANPSTVKLTYSISFNIVTLKYSFSHDKDLYQHVTTRVGKFC